MTQTLGRSRLRTVQVGIVILAAIILAIATIRLINDVPHIRAGRPLLLVADCSEEYIERSK